MNLTKFIAFAIPAFAITATFLPISYVTSLNYVALNTLVCIGLVLLTGVAGLTSFGQAAFVGVSGYTTALLGLHLGLSPWMTLPLCVASTLGFALIIGALTIRLSGHYLVLATIAWGLSLFYLFGNIPALGGFNGLPNLRPLQFLQLSFSDARVFFVLVWCIIGLLIWAISNLLDSRVGRAMRSVRSSTMAESVGVNTRRMTLHLFLIAAFTASIAGWLHAHYLAVVAPSSYNINASLDYLFMTVIGGTSHLLGAVFGPFIFEAIRIFLRDMVPYLFGVSGNYELALFALLVIVILQKASGGAVKYLARWLPQRRKNVIDLDLKLRLPSRAVVNDAPGAPLLELGKLVKKFAGLTAVNEVGFTLNRGEILALIGPNGAGKSTLFNLITGVLPLSSGTVRFLGKEIQGTPTRAIAAMGVARTFQHVQLRPRMSVLDNVALGAHLRGHSGIISSALRLDRKEENRILGEAMRQLERVGMAELAHVHAGNLALGQQRMVEIARALTMDPILLLLDEPAAGLRYQEKQALATLLKKLKSEGMSILIVEHDMEFVMNMVDRIVVVDFGMKIAEGTPLEIQLHKKVIEAYLGPGDD
jgi:branched-chain amino acid transport system permease protein